MLLLMGCFDVSVIVVIELNIIREFVVWISQFELDGNGVLNFLFLEMFLENGLYYNCRCRDEKTKELK